MQAFDVNNNYPNEELLTSYAQRAQRTKSLETPQHTEKRLMLRAAMQVFDQQSQETFFHAESANNDAKIVFVNRFYWPDTSATSQLLTDLAEHVASSGRRVLIITSKLSYTGNGPEMKHLETQKGVEIRRVRTTRFYRHSLAGQFVNFLTFYVSAALALLRETRRSDIIVVKTDPPLFNFLAWMIARLRRAKMVNWCQDLFPEVAVGCGVGWAIGPIGAAVVSMRNFVLNRSESNVVVSSAMKVSLQLQGVHPHRIEVIRNWSVGEVQPVPVADNSLRRAWSLEDCFVIGYSGNLGRAHLTDEIHFLIRQFANVPKLKFLFIGAGYGMKQLQSLCSQEGHHHVLFKPYQPKQQLRFSLSAADLHLVSLNARCQYSMSPSKYYGILAAGRPVALVGSRQSHLAQEIEEFDLGLVLDLHERGLWRPLIESVRDDRDRLTKLGRSARTLYDKKLAPAYSLSAWMNVIAGQEAMVRTYDPARTTS